MLKGTPLQCPHQRANPTYCNRRRLMVRHGFEPLLVHMLETSSRDDAVLHAAFIRRAASTILARLANRCGTPVTGLYLGLA